MFSCGSFAASFRLVERGGEARSSVVRPPSIHGTLTRHHALATLKRPTSTISSSVAGADERDHEPRIVYLEMKKAHSLGISLVGGNAVGIYVHAVQADSPAHKVPRASSSKGNHLDPDEIPKASKSLILIPLATCRGFRIDILDVYRTHRMKFMAIFQTSVESERYDTIQG